MTNKLLSAPVSPTCQKCMKNAATQRVLKSNKRDHQWVCNRCADKSKPAGWF